ncbi:uncharacterized protein [Spinacia oleracea]|uniref:Transposase-associated domain-containing protein n=1 Tax=Spinacia oleracea TaxID=3562 RepID=A0A9R0IZB8_SPIOL|nr:uncharacterized protein LOC110797648 [Spinacia oleracea]XP_021858449.2 uncharacterized protein LOC110797648 [Spinacia oleracea]
MKRRERSWMYDRLDGHHLKPEFVNGVGDFIEFCKEHPTFNDHGEIRCPCSGCDNRHFHDVETVKVHLYKKGFVRNYFDWICHGEILGESLPVQSNPCQDMVVDALGNNQEHLSYEETNSVKEEPTDEAKKLFDLLKAGGVPLYKGSKISVLEMAPENGGVLPTAGDLYSTIRKNGIPGKEKVPCNGKSKQIKDTYEKNDVECYEKDIDKCYYETVGGRKKRKNPCLGSDGDLYYKRSSRWGGSSSSPYITPCILSQISTQLEECQLQMFQQSLEFKSLQLEFKSLQLELVKQRLQIEREERQMQREREEDRRWTVEYVAEMREAMTTHALMFKQMFKQMFNQFSGSFPCNKQQAPLDSSSDSSSEG